MNKYKQAYIILIFFFCLFLSCKKDSTKANDKMQLLTKSSWQIKSIRQSINSGVWTDLFSSLPNCKKDNRTEFRNDLQ
jgi:hypothetical protein